MKKNPFEKELKLAVKLAKEAGRIQLVHAGKAKKIEFKGAINLVTEVDKKCEALIIKGIKAHFPDHDVLAEEGSGKRQTSGYRWIVDP
ncbi:MAG: inositol monophosphatase, partial [Deltaproteobacteria bacterium]|nr:inositol monophosphatase [Deltaproteobacteria bacterium]